MASGKLKLEIARPPRRAKHPRRLPEVHERLAAQATHLEAQS